MMNKSFEIENTLKDLYNSMDGVVYSANIIYQYLIFRDVPKDDRKKVLSNMYVGEIDKKNDLFYKWIAKFKLKKNITVFCNEIHRYFCQFINGNIVPNNCYKLYVSVDYDHIYKSAIKIFDFIRKNNIVHESKIGKKIRFDDIVIRVNSEEDVKKIIDFVNNDSYIKSGTFRNNVFAFSDGIVNVAYDGNTSYNSFLSATLADYLNDMRYNKNASVDEVSIASFANYLDNLVKKGNCYNGLLRRVHASCEFSDDEAYKISNLIKLNMYGNDISEYYNFMRTKKFDSYKQLLNKEDDYEKLFNDVVLYIMKEYGREGFNNVSEFFNGNYNYLNNNQELYNKFVNNKSDVMMYYYGLINNNFYGMEFNDYLRVIMMNDIINSSCIRFREYASKNDCSLDKLVLDNINGYIQEGKKNYITNSVNGARKLLDAMDNKDMIDFFKRINVRDIYEYKDSYYVNDEEKRKKL